MQAEEICVSGSLKLFLSVLRLQGPPGVSGEQGLPVSKRLLSRLKTHLL